MAHSIIDMLLLAGSSEKGTKHVAAPAELAEVSSADRKRNEKEMKDRTVRFVPVYLLKLYYLA